MEGKNTKLKLLANKFAPPNVAFSVTYTFDDYFSTSSKYYSSFKNFKRNKKFFSIYFVLIGLLIAFTNVADLIHKFNWFEFLVTVFYLFFLILYFFVPANFYHKLSAYITYYTFRVFMPISFSIDEYGITNKGRFSPKNKIAWSSFSKFIINEKRVLLVRKLMYFPMFVLVSHLPRRCMKKSDWEKFVDFIKYREEILVNIKQPNRFIRWSIRLLFIILIELSLWCGYIDLLILIKANHNSVPFTTPLVILSIWIPFLSLWIDFKRYSVKKNLLFPLGAFILMLTLFMGMIILISMGYILK